MPLPVSGPRWFCVTTEPRGELRTVQELTALGFTVHCPMVVEDDSLTLHVAFTGYVFVAFDAAVAYWPVINEPPRRRLIADQLGNPVPVRRGYIEDLLAAVAATGYIDARPDAASWLSAGAAVRITDGPLTGFTARIVASAGKFVKVEATILGEATPITLPRSSVQPA